MKTLDSRIVITALDRASKVFGGIGGNADAMAGKFARADRRISQFGLMAASSLGLSALGVAGFAASSVKAYARWEDRLVQFGNVINTSGQQLDTYGDRLRDGAAAVGQSREAMLSAAELLAGRGMNADVAVGLADDVGRAATAAGGAITDMAEAGFAAFSNLKMAEEEIPKAFDMMAEAGKQGGFELKDMARWMPELTASMAELGTTGAEGLAEIAAASQIAMKNAGSPDQAANNLSNFFGKLRSADTTKKFREKLGIDLSKVFQNSAKNGTSYFLDMLNLIEDKTKGDPFKIAELFSDKQAADALRALLANREEFERILGRVRDAKGVIDIDFERRMETLSGKMAQLSAKWEQLKLKGGEFIAPAALAGLQEAIELLDSLPSLFENDVKDVQKLISLYHHLARLMGAEPTTALQEFEDRIRRRHGLPLWEDVTGLVQDEQRRSREGLTESEMARAKARKQWFEGQLNGNPINDDMIRQQMIDEGLVAPPPQGPDGLIPIPRPNPRSKRQNKALKKMKPPTQEELEAAWDEIWKWKFEQEKLLPDIDPPSTGGTRGQARRAPPRTFQGGHDTRDAEALLRDMDIGFPDAMDEFDRLPRLRVVPRKTDPGKGGGHDRPGVSPEIRSLLEGIKFEPQFAPGTLDSALAGKVEAELKGQAEVTVRVQVDGPGRVTGFGASNAGDVQIKETGVDATGRRIPSYTGAR